ncbi:MAG: hypothetical protein HYT77_03425 [Deltaproteobacteria bacterium]|nr:hypothetical protein [Deltaproteobacteria bacterium]
MSKRATTSSSKRITRKDVSRPSGKLSDNVRIWFAKGGERPAEKLSDNVRIWFARGKKK